MSEIRRHPRQNPTSDLWSLSSGRDAWTAAGAWAMPQGCRALRPVPAVPPDVRRKRRTLRKEVIQPQVPLRLPCYDFTPVADLTVDGCLPNPKIRVSSPVSGQTNSHGVTGGVYKARERIHRGMLIHDY
jgi:hypothetical protein